MQHTWGLSACLFFIFLAYIIDIIVSYFWRLQIKVLVGCFPEWCEGRVSSRLLSLACRQPFSPCVSSQCFLCVCFSFQISSSTVVLLHHCCLRIASVSCSCCRIFTIVSFLWIVTIWSCERNWCPELPMLLSWSYSGKFLKVECSPCSKTLICILLFSFKIMNNEII